MTDFMIVEIKFKSSENAEEGFEPIEIDGKSLFIMREGDTPYERTILQLTVEGEDEVPVGVPFYEFHPIDDTIEALEIRGEFNMDKYFREIGYERWVLKADEEFAILIKTP